MFLNNELHPDNRQNPNQEDTKLNPYTHRKNYFDYNRLQNNNNTGDSTVAEIIPKTLNVQKHSPSSSSSSKTSKGRNKSPVSNSISFIDSSVCINFINFSYNPLITISELFMIFYFLFCLV